MAKRVTIQQLADTLNLSTATVSRALNDHPLINADTKRAVGELAEKLGYAARQPAHRPAPPLGVKKPIAWITPLMNFHFEDPIILEIIGGMVSRSVELERHFLHIPTDAGHELDTYRELIASGEIGGFILANRLAAGDRRLEFLLEQNIPFISYGATPASKAYPWVRVDFAHAYWLGTRHLIELGHRRIALLNAMPGFQASAEREAGYRKALSEVGVDVSENWIVGGPKNEEFGYRTTQQLLDTTPVPTAIVCSSVMTAKSAVFAIRERGLEIGRDVSIIAFDDNVAGTFHATPLTTMFSPVRPLGRRIVDLLERAIDGEDPASLNHVQRAELVIRGSSGPAAALSPSAAVPARAKARGKLAAAPARSSSTAR
jgi:LacI family transcriptional regulator